MRIVTLIENTAIREDLREEHGLSLYIESMGHRILFDAGQSGAFADNADLLGVALDKVDCAVLSHGHYDHGGGLAVFLERNVNAPVFLNRHAFEPHYNRAGKDIGLDPDLENLGRLRYVDDGFQIGSGITLHNHLPLTYPLETYGLTMGQGVTEDFRHEQYLLVEENGRKICISGCSHRGVLNIMEYFRPDIFIGGFHFKDLPTDSAALYKAAEKLSSYGTRYYTGHCTGLAQSGVLKEVLGDRLALLSTGGSFEI